MFDPNNMNIQILGSDLSAEYVPRYGVSVLATGDHQHVAGRVTVKNHHMSKNLIP